MAQEGASAIISLPQGGGALQGIGEKFSPDLHTGTGNFTVPIAVPPGRNGFQPQLSLVYSTGNGNGPFGLGWHVSIPGVSRKTSKGIPRYDDESDVFILSGAEDLVAMSGAYPGRKRYRPRTEGLFALIEHQRDPDNNFWEVRSKDGLISTYGSRKGQANNDTAVIANPTRRDYVSAWKLTETRDAFGNLIEYQYKRDQREESPHAWDQLYLQQVRYADYLGDDGETQFLVTVDFIYQDYPDSANPHAIDPRDVRPDPFSDYRSGFEIRTRLLCKRIIVKTHAGNEQRVRTYDLIYLHGRGHQSELDLVQLEAAVEADPANTDLAAQRDAAKARLQTLQAALPLNGVSVLSQIKVTGHDGAKSESLPPLEFQYTRFEPEQREFFPLQGPDLPAQSLANPDVELVDLFGYGLPDMMEMNGVVRYWRNLGGGRFDPPRIMQDTPAGFSLSDDGVQFIDANGDGRTDLFITNTVLSGYFPIRFGGRWDRDSFQRYAQAPSFNLEDPEVKLVDLDGDGVTDAIRSGSRLECFFSDPIKGWNKTRWVERQALDIFPNVNFSDPRVKWADLSGDGLQDIALVSDGNVEYWPNLGHGNWAKRIHMDNSPRFPYGYDPKRILVGDVDGDGLADIVYVDDNKVTLWINQSGNRWSNPITIAGTPPVSDIDAVRLVDMLGTGISGVLWSRDWTGLSHDHMFFLDFTGGLKPYLLNEMDNHIGAVTKVEYAPSTRFYLEDQRFPETRWKTTLPFPVHVVSRVEVLDYFSRGKLTTEYSYHHGYWDGGEREFRGFGMVEQRDTELFEVYDRNGLHGPEASFARVEPKYFSPPTLSKSWFHQGPVGDEFGDWEEVDRSDEYWSGDPQLLKHTETVNKFLQGWPSTADGRRVKRDALRTLRGSILRTELYALDGSEREGRPYTVTEFSYRLVEIEPPAGGDIKRLHVFFPHPTSRRTTQWERGDDPMTQFSFTRFTEESDADKFDPFGRPLAQTRIACPRGWRTLEDLPATQYLATRTRTAYAVPIDPQFYNHTRVASATSYEIVNTTGKRIMDVAATKDSSTDLKVIGQTCSFYDGEAFVGLPMKQVGKFGAITRTESLNLTDKVLQDAYGAQIPPYIEPTDNPTWATDYPLEFRALLPRRAGYVFHAGSADPADPRGYFANTDRRRYDFQTNLAGSGRGLVLESHDPLHDASMNPEGHRSLIEYDQYQLLPKRVTDAAGLTVAATYDYRVFQPSEVTDPNGNQIRFSFSPLGHLENTISRGKTSTTEGDQFRPSVRRENGFLAFENSPPGNRKPIFVRTIRHIHHDTELEVPPTERGETITTLEFSDGFGRLLQTRTQGEELRFGDENFGGGEGVLPANQTDGAFGDVIGRRNTDELKPNVVVSGWQVYDNKGQVVEKYEPFFSEGWDFGQPEDSQTGQKAMMFYDPRGQTIRTVNPDGSEQRVIYGVPGAIAAPDLEHPENFEATPWEAYTYDANDNAGRTHSESSSSYQYHWNTPASILIDAFGRTIKAVERNRDLPLNPGDPLPPIKERITRTIYDIRGNVLTIIDALGREAFHSHVYDYANRSLRTESIDAGVRKTAMNAAGSVIEQHDAKGALVLHGYDNLNRPLRLWARDGDGQKMSLRERLEYGDGGSPNQAAADRATNRAANRLGRLSRHFDEAGLLTFEAYDFKGNLLEKNLQVLSDDSTLAVFSPSPPGWKVEAFRVDWISSSATSLDPHSYKTTIGYDALNRVKLLTNPEDVEHKRRKIIPHYNRAGALERVSLDEDTFVDHIAYNAKGQRVLIAFGNGVMTRYAYDAKSFRLRRLRSEKFNTPGPSIYRPTGDPLQESAYVCDLAGNILSIRNRTPSCGIRDSLLGEDALDREFYYDALYRLCSATGRECDHGPDHPWDDKPRCTDLTKTRSYTEQYSYDLAGNIKHLKHLAEAGSDFSRDFELVPGNNRLGSLTIGATPYAYTYDANGNMMGETTSRHFEWDFADRMRVYRTQTGASEPSVHAQYHYDTNGQRVKKLVRKQGGQVEVTIYIDGVFEYHRIVRGGITLENNTLHVMDYRSRIAMVRIGTPFADDITPDVKYQLGDNLGSSNVVMDGLGGQINCEEYTPYGESSFGSYARKRYRFTGKERDEESSLSYHEARYYMPWLGRWTSCDPIGPCGGLNVFQYAHSNPLSLIDLSGMDPDPPANGSGGYWKTGAPAGNVDTGTEVVNRGTEVIMVQGPVESEGSNVPEFEPPESVPGRFDEVNGRGRIEGQDVLHFGKGVLESVGRAALTALLGPVYGPVVVPLVPESKVDPKHGGGELIGRAAGAGIVMGVEAAAVGGGGIKAPRVTREAAKDVRAASSVKNPITSTATRAPITSTSTRAPIASTSPRSTVVASEKGEPVAAPKVEDLVPSLRPDRQPGTTPHPFADFGRDLHPAVFDIIEDLQAARAGDAAAASRIAARNPHVLTGDLRGWTSLDISGRHVGARFLYKEVQGGIEWMVRNTH